MNRLKTILSLVLITSVSIPAAQAQKREKVSQYETKIYTSDKVGTLIRDEYRKQSANSRGYLSDLGIAALNAGKGVAGGYVGAFVDVGVNALVSLFTKNATNKQAWENIVKAENSYTETLATLEPINNFYSAPSFDGPLDPAGMNFYGIGCVRTVDKDTVFYISTHIDEAKINRIINHSKFELSLDTLIIDPYKLDLPNSNFPDAAFSFDERKDLQITVEIRLISSWINELTQLQNNQELGSFAVNIPISKKDLDANGKLRYALKTGEPAQYKIAGESFIVPRSFMGYRDEENNYRNSWGTGDYDVQIKISESCGITENYRKQWKADWKRREDAENSENFVQRTCKLVSSQKWNELTKQWVVTTIKAPADIVTDDLLETLGLPNAKNKTGTGGVKK
jgi:hypothetical protein